MSDNLFRTFRTPLLVLLVLAGLIGAAVGVTVAWPGGPPTVETVAADPSAPLRAEIARARQQLDRVPGNTTGWAALGAAYVELARITADPEHYGAAQRALDRSIELKPRDNADALIGFGALANALHDFTAARDYGERALALRPNSADAHGVLIDALTQLGEADAATAAVQRMLELRPGVPSFTRAAYDLELHGRTDDAAAALRMALTAATTADQIAFCRYHLGELAFDTGNLDQAESEYRAGLLASPHNVALRRGMAKVTAARGDLDGAVEMYQALTAAAPLPEYLIEMGELLEAARRPEEAAAVFHEISERFRRLEEQGVTEYIDAAHLAAEHGDPTEAVRFAELEFGRRQSVITSDVLAWSLHKAGRDAEALGYADRAAALGWRSASLAYHRGMILAALGRADQAAAALTTALEINPHFSPLHAPRARQALATLAGR